MDNQLKHTLFRWLPTAIIGISLIVSLYLLHLATQDTIFADQYGEKLLYLNGFILIVLGLAIFINLLRIVHQWHTRQAGSRFTIRLMSGFLILTLFPVVIVSAFSMNFIGKRIGQWFDVRIETALDDSLELAQISFDIRTRQHLEDLTRLRPALMGKSRYDILALLDEWRYVLGAHEMILLADDQRLYAMSVGGSETLVPRFPAKDLYLKLSLRDEYYHLEPIKDGMFSRVALRVQYADYQTGILTALFPISEREQALGESVLKAQEEYKEISFNRELLKDTFRLALMVIVVLTVLFALWAAFQFSRRLTQPVRELVEGTLAVASGDLEKKLPVSDKDDFSLLARSFNTMTRRLSDARTEREYTQQQLQQQHDYLFVVLEHLSSGVVTLGDNREIRRVNSAANQILGYSLQQHLGETFKTLCESVEQLKPFLTALEPWMNSDAEEWQTEIALNTDSGRKMLVCRGAGLPEQQNNQRGFVLVFDDVTELIQAEHDAAWSEVARRLAHEIKNPLTPIQLSAERLSRKLGRSLNDEDTVFLERMTRTIIQQVDALKTMVNAFSDYAKAPTLVLQSSDLGHLVREVAELYTTNTQQVQLEIQTEATPLVQLDHTRIRQLVINLIKNALEALESLPSGTGVIRITVQAETGQKAADEKQAVVLTVQDNGSGFPEELLPKLFEPYVTNKHKGTGLGLAIVKKIVEEHQGTITAKNVEPNGAMINIRFAAED